MAGGRQEVPDKFRTAACRFNVLNLSPKINCLAGKFGAAEWRTVIHNRGLSGSLADNTDRRGAFDNDSGCELMRW